MNNVKAIIIVVLVVLAGIAIYFVNKDKTPVVTDRIITDKTITEAEVLDSTPVPSKQYKIGVLFPMLAAPFWVHESYGIVDQAKKIGVDVVLYSADGYANVDKQNAQIEDLITQKVDAILVAPTSLNGNNLAIEKAIKSGIPVIIHVTDSTAKGVTSRILADDYQIGKLQAQYIAKALGGKGSVIMLTGPSGADWALNRTKGFKEYMAGNAPDIAIVAERSGEPDRSTSQKLMEELLVKFKDVDAVYTAADGMAMGVADVLSRTKTDKKVILTTSSFSKETVPYIRSGQISLNINESSVLEGRTAINTVIYSLEGYKVPEAIYMPLPGIDKTALEQIDMDTQWAPDGFSPLDN